MSDQFKEVGGAEKIWNCRQTGSKKDGNRVELPATDKSWIHGWYLGSRVIQQPGMNPSTIHKMRVIAFGDPKHSEAIKDTTNGEIREFFGTTALNSMVAERIQPGQCVKILFIGKQAPKKAGGNSYDGWKIFEDTQRQPISVFGNVVPVASTATTEPVAQGADLADDDDIPF